MIFIRPEFLRVNTHSFEYIFFCLVVIAIIAIISSFSKNKVQNQTKAKNYEYDDAKKDIPRNEKRNITSLQELFTLDFEKVPDETFFFDSDIDINNKLFVNATKLFDVYEANIFPGLSVNIFEDGSLNMSFFSSNYDPKRSNAIKRFISSLYQLYGKDDLAQIPLNYFNLKDLTSSFPVFKSFIWDDKNVSLIIDKNINFSFTHQPTEKYRIVETFFKPNIKITKHGILSSHELKLNKTEASLLIDDFTKRRSIIINKVADSEFDKYVYTYTLNNNPLQILSNLTKLGISFSYSDKYFFLHLISFDKEFQLAKDDSIIFLFDDETAINTVCATSKATDSSGTFRNLAHLNYNEIKIFATKKLIKWKMTSKRKALYQIGGAINNINITQYKGECEGQFLLQLISRKLIQAVIIHEGNYFGETLPDLLPE